MGAAAWIPNRAVKFWRWIKSRANIGKSGEKSGASQHQHQWKVGTIVEALPIKKMLDPKVLTTKTLRKYVQYLKVFKAKLEWTG